MFFGGLSNDKPIPKDANALLFLSANVEKFQAKLIIIGTIQAIRIANKKEGYGSAEEEFSALRHLAHELKITIICVHHTKKKTDYEIEPLDSILGLQGIAATVETILIMQSLPQSKDVNLLVTRKDVEPHELHLFWQHPGFSDANIAAIATLGYAQKEVLEYIKAHPRCTQSGIVHATEKPKSSN